MITQDNTIIGQWIVPLFLANRWLEEGRITEQNLIDYYMDETGTVTFKFIK